MKNHHKLFIAASLLAAGQSAIAAETQVKVYGKVRAALSITNLSDPADTNSAATVVNFGDMLPEGDTTELSSLINTTSGCPVSTAGNASGTIGFAKITFSGDSGAVISLPAVVSSSNEKMKFHPAPYASSSNSCEEVTTADITQSFGGGTSTFYLGGAMETAADSNGEIFDTEVKVTVSYP